MEQYYQQNYSRCMRKLGYFDSFEFVKLSAHSLMVICIIVHCFGFYCILFKSPAKMMNCRMYLLNIQFWAFILDLYYSTLMIPIFYLPSLAASSSGLLSWFGLDTLDIFQIGILAYGGLSSSIIMIFDYRDLSFMCVSKREKTTRTRPVRYIWHISNFLFIIGIVYSLAVSMGDTTTLKLYYLERNPCPIEQYFTECDFTLNPDSNIYVYSIVIYAVYICSQGICIAIHTFYNIFIIQSKFISKATKRLQQALFKGTCLQVSYELLLGFGMTLNKSKRGGYSQGVKKIAFMASTVAFEFNKATLKLRRSLHLTPSSSPKSERKKEDEYISQPSSTKSTSRGGSTKNRQLCAELSSFALYPIFGALSPSHFSSPNLLFQNEKRLRTTDRTILHLTDSDLFQIMSDLDVRTLTSLSQTCKRFRRICKANESKFPTTDVCSHEIVISFNQIKKKTEVRLLKRERTRMDPKYVGSSIEAVLPMFSRVLSKITFETSVFVSDWIEEILELYRRNRFIPLTLVFTGGALTKGTSSNGADLKCLSEMEFIDFVHKLQPHLQEVQLATSRLFKVTSSPPRLLGLISVLSSFGIVYERPPLRFFVDEIANVITVWRNDDLARSCDVYMRRPRDGSIDIWNKFGSVEEYRTDPFTDEILVSKITIKHSFLVQIELVLHFH